MSPRRALAAAAGLVVFVFAATALDVVLRARSSYLEGEKWLAWSEHPELKAARLDAELAARRGELAAERAAGRLSEDAFMKQLALARFARDRAVGESALKYAYVWFESAAELFTPPESRWSALARARLGPTRELWRQELRSRGLPSDDGRIE